MTYPGECGRLPVGGAGLAVEIPPHINLAEQICDRRAERSPDAVAVIEHRRGAPAIEHSFGALRRRSVQIAGALVGLGVTAGDRIAIALPQGFDTLAAHIATLRLGCISVPLSPSLAGDGLGRRLADSGAHVLLGDAATAARLIPAERPATLSYLVAVDDCSLGDVDLGAAIAAGSELTAPAAVFRRDDPAFIFYTSGSTGPAKGVTLAARTLFALIPGFRMVFDLATQPGDVFWTPSDWAWLGSLGEVVLTAVHSGCPIVASAERLTVAESYDLLEAHGVTGAFLVPYVLRRMQQAPPVGRRFALRAIMTGGECFPPELHAFVETSLGCSLNDDFGSTECTHLAVGCAACFHTPTGAIGRVPPGRRVAILGQDGTPVGPGSSGEIAVASDDPIAMLGYWNGGKIDRDRVSGRWLGTGDLGRIDENGYLWFERRSDDVLKSKGVRIGAEEVELALTAHLEVLDAGVVGLVDEDGNDALAAFVATQGRADDVDALAAELKQFVRQTVAGYASPRWISTVEAVPRTSTGKVDRARLRELASKWPGGDRLRVDGEAAGEHQPAATGSDAGAKMQ